MEHSKKLVVQLTAKDWNTIEQTPVLNMGICMFLYIFTLTIGGYIYMIYISCRQVSFNGICKKTLLGIQAMERHFGFEGDYLRSVEDEFRIRLILSAIFSILMLALLGGVLTYSNDINSATSVIISIIAIVIAILYNIFVWKFLFNRIKAYKIFKPKQFEKSLMRICEQMNINYYSTGLEAHKESGSTWFGMGTIGISVALIGNVVSKSGAFSKNGHYKIISLLFSYNQIADYFNKTYFPEEYQALPQEINLS
ncbi:MAG: hypothetical protein LBC86_07095 [Oscillospiraceae bacterium]|jgi:hypothetical protein|nr:hypothetical protein [Oscillospiraceae bacterium]